VSSSSLSSSVPQLICDFEREEVEDELCTPACSWEYISTTISKHPEKKRVHLWEVFDNLTDEKLASNYDGTASTFIYAWPYKSEFRIKLIVRDPDGNQCSVEKVYFDEDCFEPCPATGGGGGAPPYKQNYDKDPPCDVIIKKVYIVDEKTDNIENIVVVQEVWLE